MEKTGHLFFIGFVGCFIACNSPENNPEKSPEEIENQRYDLSLETKLTVFEPLSANASSEKNPSTSEKIKLGQQLYFDKQLSKNGTISCNSCHNLETFGVDNLSTSPGDEGKNGDRNSPTVLNAAFHRTQFWDGRASDVEEQAGMPILNPVEMAIPNESFLVQRLSKSKHYQDLFAKAFPDQNQPITFKNLSFAIASFERKLITPSRFDDYLNGDKEALTIKEKKGMLSFINVGCATCHNGEALGGVMFQKFGVYKNYWELTESKTLDEGKSKVSGIPDEKYVFKVPSLRNIEKTGPYFHDGSIDSLGKAVDIMALAQLNVTLSKSEKENILAFLNCLTGSIPFEYQKAP